MKKYLVGFVLLFSSMAFSMESGGEVTVSNVANHSVWWKISKEIRMSKSRQVSNDLEKIAFYHTIRYFDRNRKQNLNRNSQEFKLIFNALIAIEKTFPAISWFHKSFGDRVLRLGKKKLALLPKSNIGNVSKANLHTFFKDYEIEYEGINSFKKLVDEERKEHNLTEKPLEIEDITGIEAIDRRIQAANASWQKPDLSSPLHFVYFLTWGDCAWAGFLEERYLIVEVKELDSPTDDEFRAQVTIDKQFGHVNADGFKVFCETFFPPNWDENKVKEIMGMGW